MLNALPLRVESQANPAATERDRWYRDHIKQMMQNTTYAERATLTLPSCEHETGSERKQGNWSKPVVRDRAEWIAIKVPAICPAGAFRQSARAAAKDGKAISPARTHHLFAGSDPVR